MALKMPLVEILVQRGADVNRHDCKRRIALHWMASALSFGLFDQTPERNNWYLMDSMSAVAGLARDEDGNTDFDEAVKQENIRKEALEEL